MMSRHAILLLLALLAGVTATAKSEPSPAANPAPPAPPQRTHPAKIIIKADDLRAMTKDRIHPRWLRFIDEIKRRGIKASIGIICDSLEADNPKYFQAIKDLEASGLFEFWNHGYDHLQWTEGEKKVYEFQGSSYEHQKDHFTRSNQLAREKLGITFRTFGPPFNVTDENTLRVLQEDPETKVWLYGDPKAPNAGKIVLERLWDVTIEKPLFVPNLAALKEGYFKHPERDCFVIQGHPSQWDDQRFAEFQKILDFLTEEGAVFTTPSAYCATVTPTMTTVTPPP